MLALPAPDFRTVTAVALLALASLPSAQGSIIDVPADQPTIQAAIDAAGDGDTIRVDDGTYFENLIVFGKSITLQSTHADPALAILDGGQAGRVVTFDSNSDCTLRGFTIRNGEAAFGGGIACRNGSDLALRSSVIRDNHATSMGGGLYAEASAVDLVGNQILFNASDGPGGGVAIISSAAPAIVANDISDNQAQGDGGGVYVLNSSASISESFIERNVAYGNGGGVCYDSPTGVPIVGNLIWDNTSISVQNDGGGWWDLEQRARARDRGERSRRQLCHRLRRRDSEQGQRFAHRGQYPFQEPLWILRRRYLV